MLRGSPLRLLTHGTELLRAGCCVWTRGFFLETSARALLSPATSWTLRLSLPGRRSGWPLVRLKGSAGAATPLGASKIYMSGAARVTGRLGGHHQFPDPWGAWDSSRRASVRLRSRGAGLRGPPGGFQMVHVCICFCSYWISCPHGKI